MAATLKAGLIFFGLGLLGFLAVFTVVGPLGPCANESQVASLVIGLAGTGIGGLLCLVSLPVVLLGKYKKRGTDAGISLTGEQSGPS
jgi:hypothetical protein